MMKDWTKPRVVVDYPYVKKAKCIRLDEHSMDDDLGKLLQLAERDPGLVSAEGRLYFTDEDKHFLLETAISDYDLVDEDYTLTYRGKVLLESLRGNENVHPMERLASNIH